MAWYLNRALTNFRAVVNARYLGRDKSSDGSIGDEAHQATSSDHNPDPDGSVDAWDMDVDLRSGNDPAAIENLKRVFQGHESSRYWIHNRTIASRSDGWRRRPYTGSNPHDKHVHWNTRESHERSTAPWDIGKDDDMATAAQVWADGNAQYAIWRVEALAQMRDVYAGGPQQGQPVPFVAAVKQLAASAAADEARDNAALAAITALAAGGGVDSAPIVAAVEAVRVEAGTRFAELQAEVARLTLALTEAEADRQALQARLAAAYGDATP